MPATRQTDHAASWLERWWGIKARRMGLLMGLLLDLPMAGLLASHGAMPLGGSLHDTRQPSLRRVLLIGGDQ